MALTIGDRFSAVLLGIKNWRKAMAIEKKRRKSASVIVGYTANYAIYVHEMVGANFKRPGSQAKFLEQPARAMQGKVRKFVLQSLKNGGSVEDGLFAAGLKLQRDSMKIVPVDTGFLRASAFTRREKVPEGVHRVINRIGDVS